MTIEGYAVMLMKERRLNKQHIHNLLLPWQGNFPSDEEQFQTLVEGIKRIGLLNDEGPNTLGQLLGGHSRHTLPVEAEDADEQHVHLLAVPRSLRIQKKDVARLGYSPNCPRCRRYKQGLNPRGAPHTATCRQRIYDRMAKENLPKYLKAQQLRDFLRVVAPSKTTYELRYFNINEDNEEE